MITKTLGGNRLGTGKKMQVQMHGFERSTHDLGYVWRNTQAPGTLVPFMNLIGLPGDTFDINLGADVKTQPTLGPLFGSFKLQLDIFQCPIRLYHAWLHNNKLKIGNNMASVKLPIMTIDCNPLDFTENELPLTFQQINQSSLLAYLGIRGIGQGGLNTTFTTKNALGLLSYWDTVKNYYSNKQEEIGMYINTDYNKSVSEGHEGVSFQILQGASLLYNNNGLNMSQHLIQSTNYTFDLYLGAINYDNIYIYYVVDGDETYAVRELVLPVATDGDHKTGNHSFNSFACTIVGLAVTVQPTIAEIQNQINIKSFPLENLDEMREKILQADGAAPLDIKDLEIQPYQDILGKVDLRNGTGQIKSIFSQEGLALKTYQSDIFNNWLNSEWIDGMGGINEITAVSTAGGSFSMDTLNLAQKVYEMLNRIAVSGGTSDDWIEAVYDTKGYRKAETPMYMGGLSKEIVFQEVVSLASASPDEGVQPLGTLGGKGTLSKKHKGGSITIKVTEPSIILGIVSITPRIDYYQGNDWSVNLKTMDDLHKPSLDEIGFQDILTDQMAFWDTTLADGEEAYKSPGKQPAWINYMTAYNKVYGNFADERNQMYMTLTRRYEPDPTTKTIKDLTTYIDPTAYNYAFAQTDLTAQNFLLQIGCDITARRKMSAKIMPNL